MVYCTICRICASRALWEISRSKRPYITRHFATSQLRDRANDDADMVNAGKSDHIAFLGCAPPRFDTLRFFFPVTPADVANAIQRVSFVRKNRAFKEKRIGWYPNIW